MTPPLHHFYHIYADGQWETPVSQHIVALRRTNLEGNLASINIGFVGSPENILAAKTHLDQNGLSYNVIAEEPTGWEQVTLTPLYEFIQSADGFVSYAHTKGAAHPNPVNTPWRLHMEYHNFVQWQTPVNALLAGYLMAGCIWLTVETAKFYGGTFWWARIDALKDNCPPTYFTRHDAEHWIGLLHDKHPLILGETVLDLTPNTIIAEGYLKDDWLVEKPNRHRIQTPSRLPKRVGK